MLEDTRALPLNEAFADGYDKDFDWFSNWSDDEKKMITQAREYVKEVTGSSDKLFGYAAKSFDLCSLVVKLANEVERLNNETVNVEIAGARLRDLRGYPLATELDEAKRQVLAELAKVGM